MWGKDAFSQLDKHKLGADVLVLQLPVEDVDADTAEWNSPEDCSSEIMMVQQVHWSAASSNSRFVAPKLWNHLPPQIRSSSLTVSTPPENTRLLMSFRWVTVYCVTFTVHLFCYYYMTFYHYLLLSFVFILQFYLLKHYYYCFKSFYCFFNLYLLWSTLINVSCA